MANLTPMLAWENRWAYANAILGCSSFQRTAPLDYLTDPARAIVWRSKVGWTVVAGVNDKIDVTEGGVARVATITPGTYLTGALMATAVTTALNAMVGKTNTYLTTYSASTFKFTVARATGTDTVVIPWASGGANAALAAGIDLGFTANDTGGTSYVGDVVCYQSRHYVSIDYGSTTTLRAICAANHNLSATGSIQTQYNTTTIGGLASGNNLATLSGSGSQIRTFYQATPDISFRYMRVIVSDVQNPEGFGELGVVFAGPTWEPTRGMKVGYEEELVTLSEILTSDRGAISRVRRTAPYGRTGTYHRLPKSDVDEILRIEQELGVGGHLFFITDRDDLPANTYYGVTEGLTRMEAGVGDGSPAVRYDVEFRFIEALG